MYNELDFSDIAPFRDHEVKGVLDQLKKDISFLHLLEYMQLDSTPPQSNNCWPTSIPSTSFNSGYPDLG